MVDQNRIFQSIRRLHITAMHDVDNFLSGIYRSAFKGRGLEFEDVREYREGDDIRSIDWNLTARSGTPFIKNFREERELTVMLVVDISASSFFGHGKHLKSRIIAEIAALIAFSAIKNHDKVGLLLFSNEVELYLRPKNRVSHVLRVIREVLFFKPLHRETNIQKALKFLGKVQKRPIICFLISDFLATDFAVEAALTAKKHELIAFHIFDSYEKSFTPTAFFNLKDLESSEEITVDTADQNVQLDFQKNGETHRRNIRRLFERSGAECMEVDTEETSSLALRRFFRFRRRKK